VIAFSGVFIAFMMYITRKWNPGFWVSLFSGWYRALQNKYYFDDFYIKGLIQKGLIPLNNLLAFIDMGIYDRYAVDGWEKVNRAMFTMAKWFDNIIVDTVAVDGTGASVRFFNVILRTIQSGKIQFYFIMIILVLTGYIWTLNI
jgi:NADH-quinone oxidoreductase subunit L